jgi:3-hydroxyacyl-[acyl-carrier-protein] dehydratase
MAEEASAGAVPLVLDVEQIQKLLPHRAPFLFVEKLTDIVPFESATGYKAVAFNEPHFLGHFPGQSVMPGVLIVEALAQTAGALVMHSMNDDRGTRLVYFMTIEKARFRKPVTPGCLLRMPVKAIRSRGPVHRFEGKVFVDDVLCAEAEFSAMIQTGADPDENPSDRTG